MARSRTKSRVAPTLTRFAERLRDCIGAQRVLLFGSQARGHALPESDYDLIIVSPQFEELRQRDRGRDLRDLFYEVGGHAPMDLICLTPDEFEEASHRITLVAAVLPEAIDLLPPN